MFRLRYVGNVEAGLMFTPYQFRQFGQLVEFDQETLDLMVERKIPLMPDWEFVELFGLEDLKIWSSLSNHNGNIPTAVLGRMQKVWDRASAYMNGVETMEFK